MSGPQPGDLLTASDVQTVPFRRQYTNIIKYSWKWLRFNASLPRKYSDALDPRLEYYMCYLLKDKATSDAKYLL